MTVYYIRNGKVVEADTMKKARDDKRSLFPSPAVSRFKEYRSPVTGAEITSSRQRERDLNQSNSYDPRDTPAEFRKAKEKRDEANAGYTGEQLDFWR